MPSRTVSRRVVTHLAANIKAHSNRSVLRPRRQHDARELRVRRAIAAPARDPCEGAKERALHRQRRRTEHDHVAELRRSQGSLQRPRSHRRQMREDAEPSGLVPTSPRSSRLKDNFH